MSLDRGRSGVIALAVSAGTIAVGKLIFTAYIVILGNNHTRIQGAAALIFMEDA